MKWFSMKRDGDADGLTGAEDPAEPREVEEFAEDLRTAFSEAPVDPASRQAHLVAMMEAAQLLADKGGSTERSTSKAHGPERQASGLPKLRRRPVFKSLAAKITAIAVVGAASLGGLATAGALPRPVQHGVATAANAIGINLPDPEDQDDEGDSNDQTGDQNDQSGDQNEQTGDQNDQTGDTNDQTGDTNDQTGDTNDQQGDQTGDQTEGDQNDQGDSTDQTGDQNDQSGDQTDEQSGDSNDQTGDQNQGDEAGDQSGDQGGGDQSGDSGGGDQGGNGND